MTKKKKTNPKQSPNLQTIFKNFDNCVVCRKNKNPLSHILGAGKDKNPDFLFLFINPTHLNISSHPNYPGKFRFPFLGVARFWRFLAEAGFFSQDLAKEIIQKQWKTNWEIKIQKELKRQKIYLTNLVKCTFFHPNPPPKKTISRQLFLLKQEIKIVNPKHIIAFGKLPFKVLTNKNILLRDYLKRIKFQKPPYFLSQEIFNKRYIVFPCYFPVGRGNPKKAVFVLKMIKKFYR